MARCHDPFQNCFATNVSMLQLWCICVIYMLCIIIYHPLFIDLWSSLLIDLFTWTMGVCQKSYALFSTFPSSLYFCLLHWIHSIFASQHLCVFLDFYLRWCTVLWFTLYSFLTRHCCISVPIIIFLITDALIVWGSPFWGTHWHWCKWACYKINLYDLPTSLALIHLASFVLADPYNHKKVEKIPEFNI